MIRVILTSADFWAWVSLVFAIYAWRLSAKIRGLKGAVDEKKEAILEKSNSLLDAEGRLYTARNKLSQLEKIHDTRISTWVNELVTLCYERSKNAGWHDNPREVGTMLALIHSEVSEALEGFRKDLMDDHLPHRPMAEVELADAVIRIFDLAGSQGFDLGGAFSEKIEYNLRRVDHKREARNKENGKKF